MSTFRRVFSSSVGTKLLIGLTGSRFSRISILHLAGNPLIFAGQDTFNEYSHTLISNPLIVPIEIGLLLIFLLHVYKAVTDVAANQAARPVGYAMKKYGRAHQPQERRLVDDDLVGPGDRCCSSLMHVKQFKYGAWYQMPATRRSAISTRPRSRSSASRSGSRFYVVCACCSSGCTCATASPARSSRSASTIPSTRGGSTIVGHVLAVVIGGGFAIIPRLGAI